MMASLLRKGWTTHSLTDESLGSLLCLGMLRMGIFDMIPSFLSSSNTNEGAGWSTGVSDPAANTNTPGSTTDTVYNFFKGQFASYTKESFNEALPLYANYTTTMNLLAQQMYGEARYICPSSVITGGGKKVGLKTYQYRCVIQMQMYFQTYILQIR